VAVAVSPAAKCVRMLSDPSRINRIKSKGMRTKQEGSMLVERNNYMAYSMEDIPPIPDYKIKMEKCKYNGIRVYYNIRTDPDSRSWHWMGCCASCCIQVWTLQGAAKDAMGAKG
jgi:hypothetical protein